MGRLAQGDEDDRTVRATPPIGPDVDLRKIRDDQLFDELLLMVDGIGLVNVVETLAKICRMKAGQFAKTMPVLARAWSRDARHLDDLPR